MDVSKIIDTAKKKASDISEGIEAFKANQMQTVKTLEKLDDNIYMLDYKYDYDIDDMMERGVESTGDLLKYAAKQTMVKDGTYKFEDGDFACTSFNAFTPDGDAIMGRNFDYKTAPCMIVWTAPKNGYKSVSMHDINFMIYGYHKSPDVSIDKIQTLMAPYTLMDGMNEKGVAIAVLELKTKPAWQNTGKKPMTTTTMMRAVLDKAATLEEAVEIFKKYDLHDGFQCAYHYHITDASGKTVLIEYVDNEMKLIYPTERENSKDFIYVANYFVSPEGRNPKDFGFDRGDRVRATLTKSGGILTETEAMALLDKVHLNYKHKVYPWYVTTLWSVVYNLEKKTFTVSAGLDYSKSYTFSVDEPKVLKN